MAASSLNVGEGARWHVARPTWLLLSILALIPQPAPLAQAPVAIPNTAMTLDVDATDAPMRMLHATLSMPARAAQ